MSTKKITVTVEVDTTKDYNEFESALLKGILMGLDIRGIAAPLNVKTSFHRHE